MQKRSARVKCKNSLFKPFTRSKQPPTIKISLNQNKFQSLSFTVLYIATITMSHLTETPAIVSLTDFQRLQCP